MSDQKEQPKCSLCGEPMPLGEEMFHYHGYSGPCPKPPLPKPERMLKWFAYSHLPQHLQSHSKPFGDLAERVCETIEAGPERTVALRKLLEAKDAAVRAALNPGS